jgi:hypothetical protein
MDEIQGQVILRGSVGQPSQEWRLRCGTAHYRTRRASPWQESASKDAPGELKEQLQQMVGVLGETLSRIFDGRTRLRASLLCRSHSCGGVGGSYQGTWGWVEDPDGRRHPFGGLGVSLRFRRGPWENWQDLALPAMAAPSGRETMLFSPYCATLLHEALGHAMEADHLRGSPFQQGFGKRWSCSQLTVMDRPDLPALPGSMSHDDCGLPASATTLLQQGLLVGDLGWGRGCLRRGTFRDIPLMRASNFVIGPGRSSPQTWLRDLPELLYVTSVESGHWQPGTASILLETGQIFLLRNGEPCARRASARLCFDLTELLARLAEVGQDLEADPVLHWCAKANQVVPMALLSPSLLVLGS